MTGGSSRVSIPNSVRRTIQNIKEIAGGHRDEEIYAMLRECSMDPNEAAEKLLLQDPFHEVKRKGDRKKENREPTDSRLKSVLQGRGGRGTYSSRYVSHNARVGSNVGVGKENGVTQGTDKSITSTSSPATHDTENKSANAVPVSVAGVANGSTMMEYLIFRQDCTSQKSDVSGDTSVEESSATEINKMVTPPADDVKSIPASGHSIPNSEFLSSGTTSTSGVYASASDTVLVTSCDAQIPCVIGAIGCEIGSEQTSGETNMNGAASCDVSSSELSFIIGKNSSELGNSHEQGRKQSKFNGYDVNQISAQDVSSSSTTDSMGSRPSSNYSSRSQPLDGPRKVGPTKECKPKPTSMNSAQGSDVRGTSEAQPISAGAVARLLPSTSSTPSEDTNLKLQKKLEDLQFSETHVIIPNHLQVPESQLTGLSFGSFEADFGLSMGFSNVPDSDRSLARLSESSKEVEENVDKPSTIIHSVLATREAEYLDHLQPPVQIAENILSKELQISSNIPTSPENDQPKREATLDQEGPQYSVVCTAPTYLNLGPVPPVLGSHFATLEGAESQSREASCIPGFVVQQHFDPSTSYYPQIYQSVADVNGCLSKFLPPGAAASQFNGNIAVLPQTGQSQQQSGNSSVLSSAGAMPLVTQAARVIPSSLAINQQPIPCFGQSAGVHLSHCSPNYISYSQYFSPFYVPPSTLHHLLSNTAFPQQLPTGSIYPYPAAATPANPVKYSLSRYEPPTNNNPTHTGVPAGFGTYSSSPASYSPAPAATSGNSTGNEDGVTSYKENNAYINCQQSEGPTVWVPVPGRDVSCLQAGSFHNLIPQGQHVTFTPTQAGHVSTGIYHPNQTVAAGSVHPLLQQLQARAGTTELMGPPAGAYQQPQHAAINWVNNY